LAITAAHFATPGTYDWLHDVLRRLYYIPIIVSAFMFGLRGALLTSVVVSLLYLPHAFWLTGPHAHHHGMIHADPTGTANKVLELVLYNAVAVVTGLLVEKERRARREVEQKMVEMQAMEQQLVRAGRLQALGEMGLPLHEAATVMERLPQRLVNVRVRDRGGLEGAAAVWEAVALETERLGDQGRILVRPSGTEPLVRVMAEATTQDDCDAVCDRIVAVVKEHLGADGG